VQQAVVAPGRAGVEIPLVHNDAGDAAQRQIPGETRSGDTGANDEHLCLHIQPF
jgi:hypothetical protein